MNVDEGFQRRLDTVRAYAEVGGVKVDIFTGVRSIQDQAVLWKQSRTQEQINKLHRIYLERNMPFCAKVLEEAPLRRGRWATNKAPGFSWHQFGEAIDFVIIFRQNAIWNKSNPSYQLMAELVKKEGLTSGFFWDKPDIYHVQLRNSLVQNEYSYDAIDGMMKEWYE